MQCIKAIKIQALICSNSTHSKFIPPMRISSHIRRLWPPTGLLTATAHWHRSPPSVVIGPTFLTYPSSHTRCLMKVKLRIPHCFFLPMNFKKFTFLHWNLNVYIFDPLTQSPGHVDNNQRPRHHLTIIFTDQQTEGSNLDEISKFKDFNGPNDSSRTCLKLLSKFMDHVRILLF